MDEDAERFRKALEKTGNKVGAVEPVMTMTLRYEADVDLPTRGRGAGLKPDELRQRVGGTEQCWRESRRAEGARRHGGAAGGGAGVRRRGARLAAGHAVRSEHGGAEPAGQHRRDRSAGGAVAARPTPSPSRRTAATPRSPAPTRRCGCGTSTPAASCAASSAIPPRCGASPFRPTASVSSPAARTARCGCGTWRRAARSSDSRATRDW